MTSGMSKTHYAPNTKMILVDSIEDYVKNNKHQNIGILSFEKMNAKLIAKTYYKKLNELDKAGFDIIISEKFMNKGMGRALNDKLNRAITI
jgi:L-threonylcarbamoyladenylate synthase